MIRPEARTIAWLVSSVAAGAVVGEFIGLCTTHPVIDGAFLRALFLFGLVPALFLARPFRAFGGAWISWIPLTMLGVLASFASTYAAFIAIGVLGTGLLQAAHASLPDWASLGLGLLAVALIAFLGSSGIGLIQVTTVPAGRRAAWLFATGVGAIALAPLTFALAGLTRCDSPGGMPALVARPPAKSEGRLTTAAEAEALLRNRGHDATALEPLKGGAWSTVFAFQERGEQYVVRFHQRRDDLEKDRLAERWASPSLRIPHMVEIGDLPQGRGYGIARRVAGGPIDDLNEAGMRAVLPRLFEAMDAMRDADLEGTRGYGLWHVDGRGDRLSWRDAFVGEAATRERVQQRAMLARTPVGHAAFDVGIARMSELVRWSSEQRHLVHNDLLYRNVFVDGDGIVVLDWGASIFGDFLYDVAVLTFWWPYYAAKWGGIDIRSEIERHFADIGLVVPNFAERLRLCELDIGVIHIPYQAAGGEFGNAAWTARRTAELAERDLGSSD